MQMEPGFEYGWNLRTGQSTIAAQGTRHAFCMRLLEYRLLSLVIKGEVDVSVHWFKVNFEWGYSWDLRSAAPPRPLARLRTPFSDIATSTVWKSRPESLLHTLIITTTQNSQSYPWHFLSFLGIDRISLSYLRICLISSGVQSKSRFGVNLRPALVEWVKDW